jgi:uncharacterized membrane protein
MKSSELLKGIFLLVLAVSGNFVAETLGCKTRRLLTNNMYAKQCIIISIIYFAIDFTSSSNTSPLETFGNTLMIWISFLLFTKMSELFTILCFTLLIIGYILSSQLNYIKNENTKKNNEKEAELYKYLINCTLFLFFIIMVIGFVMYYFKQRNEHKKNWDMFKFIFGIHECDNL